MMPELRFDDQVAVVTGAGGGLGREHALLLASRGAHVVVNDLGGAVDGTGADPAVAQAVADEINAAGGSAVADSNTVATAEGGAAIIGTAMNAFGRVDILVNNAGILQDKTFAKMTPEQFDAVLAVHLRGSWCVAKPAFAQMAEQNYGRIVMTTSIAGLYGNFGQTNYSSAKMGLVGLARTLALEGARRGIRANVISPAAYTRMTEGLMAAEHADASAARHVAPAVAYLCHADCELSGEVLHAAGGRVASIFVGETLGFYDPKLTIEDVAENIDRIMDRSEYMVPKTINDNAVYLQRLKKEQGA
jgi:NAD(P)-dependent dehydrogenase (short-subunit alcohol dehydrogenase family)